MHVRIDGNERKILRNNCLRRESLHHIRRNDERRNDFGNSECPHLELPRWPARRRVHEEDIEGRLILRLYRRWSVMDIAHQERPALLQYPSPDPTRIYKAGGSARQIIRDRPGEFGITAIIVQKVDGMVAL